MFGPELPKCSSRSCFKTLSVLLKFLDAISIGGSENIGFRTWDLGFRAQNLGVEM